MKYYKVKLDDNIIGVGTTSDLVRYQLKHKMLYSNLDSETCQYILVNDKLYHDVWMNVPAQNIEFTQATITEIESDEYSQLSEAFKTVTEIKVAQEEEEEEIQEEIESSDTSSVEYIRSVKISEFKYLTNKEIVKGVDYEGKHYSFTIQDQINLMALAQDSGDTVYYHADGEAISEYSKEDILKIYNKEIAWKNLKLAYFNAAKNYINSLDDAAAINDFEFGNDLPAEYQTVAYIKFKEVYDND